MPSRWISQAQPVPTPAAKVISVGTLPELLSLRHAVLKGAGFHVFSTTKAVHAMLRIENGDCGVLLLCYSVDENMRKDLVNRFRKACPKSRVILITNRPMPDSSIEADTLLSGIKGADALIAAVRGDEPTR